MSATLLALLLLLAELATVLLAIMNNNINMIIRSEGKSWKRHRVVERQLQLQLCRHFDSSPVCAIVSSYNMICSYM